MSLRAFGCRSSPLLPGGEIGAGPRQVEHRQAPLDLRFLDEYRLGGIRVLSGVLVERDRITELSRLNLEETLLQTDEDGALTARRAAPQELSCFVQLALTPREPGRLQLQLRLRWPDPLALG